jgi:hypothetical protein
MAGFELRLASPWSACTPWSPRSAPYVGASDLALETFLPADEDSAALLRELAATRPEPQHGAPPR